MRRAQLPIRYVCHARELLGFGLIGMVLLGLFARVPVLGIIAHQRDTGAFYYPLTAWFAEELRAGRFPAWCPLIFGGYPLLADGEIGMLYPPNVLALLALPTEAAFLLVRTAHYFVAGFGAYAFARVLGVGRLGGAYAGLSFALGAFMLGHLDHGNVVRSAAWLPALLACAELGLRARGRRVAGWTALAAAALALAGLGLHPQILLIDLVALWAYLPLRALALGLPGGPARPILVLGGTTLLGLAGAAVQLAPTYELGSLSSRGGGVSYAHAAAGALSPFDLVTLVLPYFFRADRANAWSLYPYWETTISIGVVGAMLALVGFGLGRPRTILPLGGLALTGLALGMADQSPVDLYGWLWTLPGFSSMRMPGRYSLIVELALAVVAGIGLDRLRAGAGARRARRLIWAVAGLLVVAVAGLAGARLWIVADEARSLQLIRASYLALPHDRAMLSAEQVRRGLLATLDPANAWTLLALTVALAAVALLVAWQRWPAAGRRCQAALVAVATAELLLVAGDFHPLAPLGSLGEPSRPMRFLSPRADGLWRTFMAGQAAGSLTSRPALFGVAQPYGYSSLPTARMERYWTRVNEVDDELLDLWNGRFVVESKAASGRISAGGVLFNPGRPLLEGTADSPLGQEAFRVAETRVDTVRVLSALDGAAELPDGTLAAEVVVSGRGAPPERLRVYVGAHTAEGADPGAEASVRARPAVGYRWEPRDPAGRVYPRNLYVADLALAAPRLVERVEVRALAPHGRFRLAGLALDDRPALATSSLLSTHREKYALVYEDEHTTIHENRAVLPRAFVVGQARSVEADEWALVYLLRRGFDPRREVLLESPGPSDAVQGRPWLPGAAGVAHAAEDPMARPPSVVDGATVEEYESDRVVVRATAASGGHLVLTDSFYPGWRAWVDGREVPVKRANSLFRAVELPPGEHLVEFRFEPTVLYQAGAVSLAAWLILAGLGRIGLRARLASGLGSSRAG